MARKRKAKNKVRLEPRKFGSILGWSSPFELICKLERELERIDNTKTLDELVDHTMNFALTAYHMVDWVWELLQRDPVDDWDRIERESWIAAIGHEPKKGEVHEWAFKQCPELEYCRQLANATKHLSCSMKEGAPAAEFEIVPTDVWKQRQKKEPFKSLLSQRDAMNWRLTLVDGNQRVDLINVFRERVFEFWSEHTHEIYIGYQ